MLINQTNFESSCQSESRDAVIYKYSCNHLKGSLSKFLSRHRHLSSFRDFFILQEPNSGMILFMIPCDPFFSKFRTIGFELQHVTSCHAVEGTSLFDLFHKKSRLISAVRKLGQMKSTVMTCQSQSLVGVIDRTDFVDCFKSVWSEILNFLGHELIPTPTVTSSGSIFELLSDPNHVISSTSSLCFLYCFYSISVNGEVGSLDNDENLEMLGEIFNTWGLAVDQSSLNLQLKHLPNQIQKVFYLEIDNNTLISAQLYEFSEVEVSLGVFDRSAYLSVINWFKLDVLFFGNDDEERFSSQTHPLLFRNLITQASPSPLGYAPFVN
ncbi:hypothetical protein P9112_000344 [Eukaryota sp. TZLM1-RC]